MGHVPVRYVTNYQRVYHRHKKKKNVCSYCLYLISCHVGSCGYLYDVMKAAPSGRLNTKWRNMKIHLVSGWIMMNHNIILYYIQNTLYIYYYILHNNLHVALPRFAEVLSNLQNAIQWVSKWKKKNYPGSELLRNLTNVKPVISPRISLFRRLLRGNDWLRRLLIRSDETLLGGWENYIRGKPRKWMEMRSVHWYIYIYVYIYVYIDICIYRYIHIWCHL